MLETTLNKPVLDGTKDDAVKVLEVLFRTGRGAVHLARQAVKHGERLPGPMLRLRQGGYTTTAAG